VKMIFVVSLWLIGKVFLSGCSSHVVSYVGPNTCDGETGRHSTG